MPIPNSTETIVGNSILKIEDGVLYISYVPLMPHELDDAKSVVAKISEWCGDSKVPVFVDGTNLASMTSEARSFYSSEVGTRNTKALAIIASTTIAKVTGTLFLGLNKPPYPSRIFTDKNEALEWLQQYK